VGPGGGEEGGALLAGEVQASALGIKELGVIGHLNQNTSVLVQGQTGRPFRNPGRSRRVGNRRAGLWLVRSARAPGFLPVPRDRAAVGKIKWAVFGNALQAAWLVIGAQV
jgi:hypothetical protein